MLASPTEEHSTRQCIHPVTESEWTLLFISEGSWFSGRASHSHHSYSGVDSSNLGRSRVRFPASPVFCVVYLF